MKQHDRAAFDAVASWVGRRVGERAFEQCVAYAGLLVDEGIRAGAIGPNEAGRVWRRHVLDSVCFAAGGAGDEWLDVGSGGGLPGIPLAACYPDIEVTLLDRAGRRIDLVRRWVRVLGLENVRVVASEIDRYDHPHDTLCFRGSLTLMPAIETTRRLARQAGVFGLSTRSNSVPPDLPAGVEAIVVPRQVLDTGATLLRITP